MRATTRRGPDPGTVAAARAGDAAALDALVAESLPLVYNIVGRALRGHADTDDVVQETLLRVVRGLHALQDPDAFRSWLVSITVRQVRTYELERAAALNRRSALDVAYAAPAPGPDFADLTILRLGLTDQRRGIAEATRWLDAEERELLSLWWLEETGELDRADLAEALGLSGAHTAVRVQRMKEQLETSRTVVRALHARPVCPSLAVVTRSWDGTPSPLWRKRVARHVRECTACTRHGSGLLPMKRLLEGLPLLPVPAGLDSFTRQSAQQAFTYSHSALPSHGALSSAGGSSTTVSHAHVAGGSTAPSAKANRHAVRTPRSRVLPRSARMRVAAAATALTLGAGVVVVAQTNASSGVVEPDAAPSLGPTHSAPPAPVTASPLRSSLVSSPALTASVVSQASVAAAPAVKRSPKKGVSVWNFTGVDQALGESGAGWYYDWSTQHTGIAGPSNVGFVPMIWGPGSVTAANLAQARSAGTALLGFNEPDMAAQSNMTVDQALGLWPQLAATGLPLGSPAVATGGADAGGWLDRFITGARAKGYRVDFIALHWYGSDFDTAAAVGRLKSYVQAVYDRYHLPIWLTEYALTDFSGGSPRFPSDAQQAAFVTASVNMLQSLPFLQRYAWFALPASDSGPSTGLFRSGPVATAAGGAFEAAG